MCHCAHGCEVVFHGEIYVARTYEGAAPFLRILAVFHRSDYDIFCLERSTTACTEVTVAASGIQQSGSLVVSLGVIFLIVKLVGLSRHDVEQF